MNTWYVYDCAFIPTFMKNTSASGRRPCAKTCATGARTSCAFALTAWNTGLSCSVRRRIIANTVTTMLLRKMSRQPQSSTWSGGSSCTATQASAPSAVPRAAPTMMSDAYRPRSPAGAVSVSRVAPPACSAPAPNPWKNRQTTSSAGASRPTWP